MLRQEHEYGCGAACVTLILKQDYHSVADELGLVAAQKNGYYCKELVHLLNKKQYSFDYQKVVAKNKKLIYRENSIVFIRCDHNYPVGHYLLRCNGLWFDL